MHKLTKQRLQRNLQHLFKMPMLPYVTIHCYVYVIAAWQSRRHGFGLNHTVDLSETESAGV